MENHTLSLRAYMGAGSADPPVPSVLTKSQVTVAEPKMSRTIWDKQLSMRLYISAANSHTKS